MHPATQFQQEAGRCPRRPPELEARLRPSRRPRVRVPSAPPSCSAIFISKAAIDGPRYWRR
jgi:hypothetical protein